MIQRAALVALGLTFAGQSASAEPVFAVNGTVEGALNKAPASVPTFAPSVHGQMELDLLVYARADVRYRPKVMEGAQGELEVDVRGRSPSLGLFIVDLHRLNFRQTTGQPKSFHTDVGLGLNLDLVGEFRVSGGLSMSAVGEQKARPGGYVGGEYVLRTKRFDLTGRGTFSFVPGLSGGTDIGAEVDGDLFVKFPVGPVSLGPRLAVEYTIPDLKGSSTVAAYLGFGMYWGMAPKG